MIISLPSFATDVTGGETCDTDVLNTDTGPVNLRAEFEPEVINLKWYNDGNQITVPTASNSCTYDTPISLPANPVKPGYKFKGWKVFTGIPIEYLQSNGAPYIDTGIKLTSNSKIETKFKVPTYTGNYPIFGASNGKYFNDGEISFFYNTKDSQLIFEPVKPTSNTTSTIVFQPNFVLDTDYTVSMDKNLVTINNTSYATNWYSQYQGTRSCWIFGTNRSGNCYGRTSSAGCIGGNTIIYYFKIYDNGTLIRDMVPVKDLSGVACMYDKVSGQFFYNAGTGDFIAGPEI